MHLSRVGLDRCFRPMTENRHRAVAGLHSVNRPRPTAIRQGHALGLHCAVEGVHGLVHALLSADFGEDRADDEKDLRGIFVESVGTAMVVSLHKRPEDVDGEGR
jgi:hypothetical protein